VLRSCRDQDLHWSYLSGSDRKSGDTLLVFLLSRATAFVWFEDATDKPLQTLQECVVTERAARATVCTQRLQFLFWPAALEQGLPIP